MLIEITFIISLLTSFIVLFISRFEVRRGLSIRHWLESRLPRLLSEMVSCDFCLCFWVSLVFAIVAMLTLRLDWYCIFVPCMATPIARFFVA